MAEFGGGVDEFQGDLFQRSSRHLWQERLSKSNEALARTHDRAFEHHPIFVHLTIVRETTHWSDGLLGQIVLRLGIHRIIFQSLAHPVDLLVDLGAMMIATLTGPGNLKRDSSRMPRANTSHLSKATMRLPRQACDSPPGHHTIETFSFRGTNHINHFILAKAIGYLHFLLKQTHHKIHFGLGSSTVHLNLLDVSFLLSNLHFANLSMANGPDHLTILLGPLHLSRTVLGFTPSLLVFGKCLLLR